MPGTVLGTGAIDWTSVPPLKKLKVITIIWQVHLCISRDQHRSLHSIEV
jgi:hypothetical protein